MNFKSIWKRYSVTIVMVPSIVALHYGWYLMQQNRALVREDEQIDLPVVTFGKFCWAKLQELNTTSKSTTTSTPAPLQEAVTSAK